MANIANTSRWTDRQYRHRTSSYKAYSRDHLIQAEGKPDVPGSSDPGVPRRSGALES